MRYAQPTVDRSDLGGRALALAQQDGQLRVCRLQCRVVLGKELPGCAKMWQGQLLKHSCWRVRTGKARSRGGVPHARRTGAVLAHDHAQLHQCLARSHGA
jgi:hypothetical protein